MRQKSSSFFVRLHKYKSFKVSKVGEECLHLLMLFFVCMKSYSFIFYKAKMFKIKKLRKKAIIMAFFFCGGRNV